jgi:hypothetical protein
VVETRDAAVSRRGFYCSQMGQMMFVIWQPQRDNTLGVLGYRYYIPTDGRLTSLEYNDTENKCL